MRRRVEDFPNLDRPILHSDPSDPERLVFSNRRGDSDAKSVLPMKRIDAPACTAQYRAHAITWSCPALVDT